MKTDKSNMLCILSILEEYSDENHILTMKEIREKMRMLYDRDIDRRTVTGAIHALMDFDYEISDYDDNKKGYYIENRKFSAAEIRLLIDAVYSCEYISQQQTQEVLEKLRSFLTSYDRKKYSYTNIISAERKSPNAEVFLNIEILDEAISAGRMVSFTYMDYDYDKKLKPRREKKYTVNPYMMICEDAHYYLALIYAGQTEPSFYRIDMMKNIEILDAPLEISKREAKLDTLKNVVYAHTGKPERITMRCDKLVLRYVIEEFGKDTRITKLEDGSFEASFVTAPEGLIYWALQYMQHVEVLEPQHVRDKVVEAIKHNRYGV